MMQVILFGSLQHPVVFAPAPRTAAAPIAHTYAHTPIHILHQGLLLPSLVRQPAPPKSTSSSVHQSASAVGTLRAHLSP
ncbi:hypothetical protein ACET3X_009705 [Alternaria dauci]|uniref:Uncharacterized protein n=1 Tax=Alternaria dauci TaxID=48095 RepID=A0ABR3U7T3_9PLEO